MTPFLMIVALWFLLVMRRRRRWALGHARRMELEWGPGREERWRRRYRHRHRDREPVPTLPPPESRFDALKRRFVSGELSAEQYEREVDALLRSPGGMTEV